MDWLKFIGLIYAPVIAGAGWMRSMDMMMAINAERMQVSAVQLERMASDFSSLSRTVVRNSERISVIEATHPKTHIKATDQ